MCIASALKYCPAILLRALALTAMATPAAAQSIQTVLWAVEFNGLPAEPGVLFLQDGKGHVLASVDFLARWNLRPPPASVAPGQVHRYVDLTLLPGLTYQVDARKAAIAITVGAEAFLPNPRDAGQGSMVAPQAYAPGAFLNYDFSATQSGNTASAQALLSAGVFAGQGLLTQSFALQNGTATRLLTTYQTDHFAQMKTLRVGDMVNVPGAWGRGGTVWRRAIRHQRGTAA